MPPKFKFTKAEIIDAAFELVREKGWAALSTRSLADKLGSSARPIYSYFKSMEALEEEISKMGVDLLYEYMIRARTGDPWHDHGIGYVMFAQKEKFLFRGLNDEKHIKYFKEYGEIVWANCSASLTDYPPFEGLSDEQIYTVQLYRWLMAHGLAFQVSTHPAGIWTDEVIVEKMKHGSIAILEGLKLQFTATDE